MVFLLPSPYGQADFLTRKGGLRTVIRLPVVTIFCLTMLQNSPTPAAVPLRESWLLFILAAIQFTHIMDFVIMMPLGPQLMRVFQISPREFGFLVSAYTFSAAISGFLSAFFIDRFDRKYALLALYLGFTLGTLACAL